MPKEITVNVRAAISRFGTIQNLVSAARAAGTDHIITRHAAAKWHLRDSMPLVAFAALTVTARAANVRCVDLVRHTRIDGRKVQPKKRAARAAA